MFIMKINFELKNMKNSRILSILSDMYVKIKSLLAWIIIKLEINNKDV